MSGFVFYRGSSLIDGSPIVGVAVVSSNNRKTGDVVQTYIIREDMSPLDASKTGADYAICGNCQHRGKPTDDPAKKQAVERSCYVLLGQGPTIVFKGLKRGIYAVADDSMVRRMVSGKLIRMGSYGDPAAIPMDAWQRVLKHASGHTGYTHNAKYQPGIESLCMVSADSAGDAMQAKQQGYRSFRVIPIADKGKPLLKHEIECPSYKGVTCSDCRLCNGAGKAKSIAIVAHGSGAKYA